MLNILGIVLIVLWLAGVVAKMTFGGLIHVILVLAIIMLLMRFIKGKKNSNGAM